MEWTGKSYFKFTATEASVKILKYVCRLEILKDLFHFFRVLEQVNFVEKFSSLPQFNPNETQSPSVMPLPSSPRNYLQSFKKKRMPSSKFLPTRFSTSLWPF